MQIQKEMSENMDVSKTKMYQKSELYLLNMNESQFLVSIVLRLFRKQRREYHKRF